MLEIYIPVNFTSEREYAIKCLFGVLLGIKYEIRKHNNHNYRIVLPNEREIIFEDHFFSAINENAGYLNQINIPVNISFICENEFTNDIIPLIFGINRITIDPDTTLQIGWDIFASSFFMLTRWEEYVQEIRDEHGRFPGTSSLASRHNFLNRPVVNEYAEILWKLISHLGYKGERIKREFRIIPTHDIDHLKYWSIEKKRSLFKNLISDLLIRKNFVLAFSRINSYFNSSIGRRDPYDTFNYLIEKADSIGTKASFYFITGGVTVYENHYSANSREVREIIRNINHLGHRTGIHPSYEAYNNESLLLQELSVLSEISGSQISEGRNHYLRFEVPFSWQLFQKSGLKIDSSIYYSDLPGFRCGICNEFPVFDILNREILDLYERPLIVMDTSFKNKEPEAVKNDILELKDTVKKYNGDFVFLWHNSKIDAPEWIKYKKSFEKAFYG